jgi:hypothetical protein
MFFWLILHRTFFGADAGQAQIMVRLVFHNSVYVRILHSVYVQTLRGGLALIIENFKAYFLALPKLG